MKWIGDFGEIFVELLMRKIGECYDREIWESSETWLNGDMFDSTMNYDFRKNCRDFFALRKISAEEFHDRIVKMLLRYRTRNTAGAHALGKGAG